MRIYVNFWYCDQKADQSFLERPVTYLVLGDLFAEFVGKDIPEMGVTVEKTAKSETGAWPGEDWRHCSYVLQAPQETQAVYLYTVPATKAWKEEPNTMIEAVNHGSFSHIGKGVAEKIIRHQFPELANQLDSA